MASYGLGPLPGTSIQEAADVIQGETGDQLHLPQLPARGLGSDAIGRTAGLLEAVNVDRGPRSWQMTNRPQLLTRRTWDRLERDLDAIAEVWGEYVPRIKVQIVGPWTMAAAVELSNGHRVITDRGARNDLYEALLLARDTHVAEIKRRFHCDDVIVQLDEPLVGDVLAGKLSGTTDFDTIRAVPGEVVHGALERFDADILNLTSLEPDWEVARAAETVVVEYSRLADENLPRFATNLDGLGEHLQADKRVCLAINLGQHPDWEARDWAIELARHCDRLSMPRDILTKQVDVTFWPVKGNNAADVATDYGLVRDVAQMLVEDAGDL